MGDEVGCRIVQIAQVWACAIVEICRFDPSTPGPYEGGWRTRAVPVVTSRP